MNWEIDTTSTKLETPWSISGASVAQKNIYLIKFNNGKYTGLGEVSYSSKENIQLSDLKSDLEHFGYIYKDNNVAQFQDLTRILDGIDFHVEQIRFAIESAFLDYLAKATDISKWRILGTNTINSVSSINSIGLFENTKQANDLVSKMLPSQILKVKVSKETFKNQVEFINSIKQDFTLDGNESWGSDLSRFVEDIKLIKNSKLLFVEQPLFSSSSEEYKELKKLGLVKIFLDESIQDHKHISHFVDLCDGIVLKSAKSKSINRLLSQLTQARNLGLKTMLGCMIESSVGISSLFPVCFGFDYYDLDGFTKLENDKHRLVYWDNGRVVLSEMN